jgi:hypothetical protein
MTFFGHERLHPQQALAWQEKLLCHEMKGKGTNYYKQD